MIDKILAGTTTEADIVAAKAFSADERKKMIERMLGVLDGQFEAAVLLENALEDVGNALKQAHPVFAAGLPVDQALGFLISMIQSSLDELESAGAADSEEYERQELVLEKLNGFIGACNACGNTVGESAQETVHLEYRGEVGKLEALKSQAEAGIANSLAFLQAAYPDSGEAATFAKGLDNHIAAARFIGTFGSPSFFAFKHVAAPGETAGPKPPANDAEDD